MQTLNYLGNSAKTGVYIIRNKVSDKVYVGSTKRAFHTRKTKHITALKGNYHFNEHLQNSWNKHSEDNFTFEIEVLCHPSDCEKYESETIKKYKSNARKYGYNIASVKEYKFNYKLSDKSNKSKSFLKTQKASIKSGLISTERGLNKRISLFTVDGIWIKDYESGKELSKEKGWTRAFISDRLSKRILYINGYIILFSNDVLTVSDIKQVKDKHLLKKVYLYNLSDELIKEFNSAKEAAIFLNCKDAEVRMCCIGRRSRIGQFKTKYESKEIQQG